MAQSSTGGAIAAKGSVRPIQTSLCKYSDVAPLCDAKSAPLGESGGVVGLEEGVGAFLRLAAGREVKRIHQFRGASAVAPTQTHQSEAAQPREK